MAMNPISEDVTLAAETAVDTDVTIDGARRVMIVVKNTGAEDITAVAVSVSPAGVCFGAIAPIGVAVGTIAAGECSPPIELPVRAKKLRVTLTSTVGTTATIELIEDSLDGGDNMIRVGGSVVGATSAGALSVTTLVTSGNTTVEGDLAVEGATTLDDATVGGDAAVTGTLDVTGAVTVDDLAVGGAATVAETLGVTGATTLTGGAGIGGAAVASAILTVTSTTKGLRLPVMTEVQRDAIAAPAEGLLVYNSTSGKLNIRVAAAWEAVTSA